MWRVILIVAIFSLAACQSTAAGGCGPLVAYSAAQQRQAAAELRRLPKDSQLARMIVHYGQTRAACCRKAHITYGKTACASGPSFARAAGIAASPRPAPPRHGYETRSSHVL